MRHLHRTALLLTLLAVLAAACTPVGSVSPTPSPVEPTQRVILIQGACSSSALFDEPDHWSRTVKSILVQDYGLTDLPNGNPEDQVIEFGYSPAGWEREYLPADTLKGVGESSAGLRDIYSTYPDSSFFIIGHSLGGVVALDGLARYSNADNQMLASTGGVITVSSPVGGLNEDTAGTAGAAIELLACRQLPASSGTSQVWLDLSEAGGSTSLIHGYDWSGVRAVNFANKKDRVVDVETATLASSFEVTCYDEGRNGFLQLNHDTLLKQPDLARDLLKVLIDGEPPERGCPR